MNNITRWERYSPVAFGMEDMFRRLDALADSGTNYPPYNIVKNYDDDGTELQQLQIALAGYYKEAIEVALEKNVLSVSVAKGIESEGEYVHRGIAQRSFAKNWQLSDDTVIDNVKFVDGMLYINLRQEIPEANRRKVLPISE